MCRAYNFMLFFFFILINSTVAQGFFGDHNFSTISEAYGYAVKDLNKSIKEMRESAYNDAKRNILEKTMIHVKSYSRTENFQITYDLIQSEAEGFLRILEKKDHGFSEDGRYMVWIKAEVIYNFNGLDNQNPVNQPSHEPLAVSIWTEKKEYTVDEKIKIYLKANKDCYIKIIYRDSDNNILQIFPNQHKKDNFIKAAQLYTIPERDDAFEFTVSPPFGGEDITLFASTSQLGESDVAADENDFYKVKSDYKEYAVKTRGVKIVKKENPAEFFESKCSIVITDN